MKKILCLGFLTFALLGLCSLEATACIHFPASYRDTITEGEKEFFVFHDGKFAHMILSTHLSAENPPSDLAWVIPFPSLPVRYEQMDSDFFKDVHDFFIRDELGGKGIYSGLEKSLGSSRGSGIDVHKVRQVGDYRIQPIEILEENSGKEFNAWLAENKFNSMPDELQKYYLKKGAVFLAIRMKPSESEITPKPLHIVYPSDRITIPLKFTHDTRMFKLRLYVFSAKPNPIKSVNDAQFVTGGLRSFSAVAKSKFDPGIRCGSTIPYNEEELRRFPKVMKYLGRFPDFVRSLGHFPELTKLLGNRQGYLTACRSIGRINNPSYPVRDLIEDPGLSVEDLL